MKGLSFPIILSFFQGRSDYSLCKCVYRFL